MAKIERVINKDFDQLLSTIEDGNKWQCVSISGGFQ